MLRKISHAIDTFSMLLGYLAGALLLSIAILQIAEIIARNFLGTSLPFVWEIGAYFHICAIFLAASFTLRTGGHIRVTLIQQISPRAFELLSTLIGLLISGYLALALVRFAINFGVTGRSSGTVNDIPLVYPAAAVAFGACLLTLQLVLRLVQAICRQPVEIDWHQSVSAE